MSFPQIAYPMQTVLISCRGKTNILGKDTVKDNVMTIDWHIPTSFEPKLYAISIGKQRFTLKLLQESKAFVVNYMAEADKDKVLFCGRNSGEHMDKFQKAGLTIKDAETIDCPIVGEAVAYLECEVIDEIEAGDHIIFIGKVLKSKLVEKTKRPFHTGGNDFTTTLKWSD